VNDRDSAAGRTGSVFESSDIKERTIDGLLACGRYLGPVSSGRIKLDERLIIQLLNKGLTASVVGLPGLRFRGPGFDSRRCQIF
jgi:hypothetical protein